MNLEDLGYSVFFESSRKKLKLDGFLVARVMAEHKAAYRVINESGEFLAKVTGRQMFSALSREDFPAVGDWVAISALGAGRAVIRAVLPRKTVIKRKYANKSETQVIAANIDVAFVVESVGRDYSLNRFERYFSIASAGGIKPAIVLNKIDLISKEELDLKLAEIKNRFGGVDLIFTSAATKEGLEKLKAYIEKSKTYCFLGSSGVGKSSLINQLLEKEVIKTDDISSGTGRGKHVTTSREMYFLKNGGIVIDNPGMREVGMADADAGIDSFFDGITARAEKCKYADCTHVHEPGCAVLALLEAGKLDASQYANYINLKKETKYFQATRLEKKEKDRRFGKFLKTAKKDFKKYKQ